MFKEQITKKTLLAGAAAVALVMMAPQQANAGWDGPYAGVLFGVSTVNPSGHFGPSEFPATPWKNDTGLLFGVQAGYNWQMDSFVMGLETDVTATDIKSKSCHSFACGGPGSEIAYANLDLLGSVRARLGMTIGDGNLAYATGGIAYRGGSWKASGQGLNVKQNFRQIGGVVGAGFEHKFNERSSIKLESLYYMFGSITAPADCCANIGSKLKMNPLVVRVGFNLNLN